MRSRPSTAPSAVASIGSPSELNSPFPISEWHPAHCASKAAWPATTSPIPPPAIPLEELEDEELLDDELELLEEELGSGSPELELLEEELELLDDELELLELEGRGSLVGCSSK